MLLIGDVHITARYKDQILTKLRDFVSANDDEQNIVFMGDFVYHFSYHRSSLLELFSLFLEFVTKGKNVYVLAGNHDWLGQYFVFSEAEKLLQMLDFDKLSKGKLHLITKPQFHNIEGKDILFFPFNLDDLSPPQPSSETEGEVEPAIFSSLQQEIYHNSQQLLSSENQNEQKSGQLNILLLNLIKKHNTELDPHLREDDKKLTVIHHHYVANTVFTGQRARFLYKDIALDPKFLDMEDIAMIAGHLHQSFVYKNFLCTGSFWHTSPTEYNHFKLLFVRKDNIQAQYNHLNPYLIVEDGQEGTFQEADLSKFMQQILQNTKKNLTDGKWTVDFKDDVLPSIASVNLIFKTQKSYQDIDTIISPELQKNIKDVKLKIPTGNLQDLAEKLDTAGKELGTSLNDRQDLLKAHIINKYQDKSERYFEVMRDLKLM